MTSVVSRHAVLVQGRMATSSSGFPYFAEYPVSESANLWHVPAGLWVDQPVAVAIFAVEIERLDEFTSL